MTCLLSTTRVQEMLPAGIGPNDLQIINPSVPLNGYSTQSPATLQTSAVNSPALSSSSKRRKSMNQDEDGPATKKRKGKGKEKEKQEGSEDESDEEGKGRKKRNRMALSCKECKVSHHEMSSERFLQAD